MRITILLITIFMLASAGTIQAQPDSLWSRTYGGEGVDSCLGLIVTEDGGYALAGGTTSFDAGSEDFYLVKTSSEGDVQWSNRYGGEGWDQCRRVIQTEDGGYILAGVTIAPDSAYRDFMLVKTNRNGEQIWVETYGYLFNDDCHDVIQTADGGYALIGSYAGMDVPDAIWLVKTDDAGQIEWTQTYDNGDIQTYGFSLLQTVNGDYAILGSNMVWGDEGLDELSTRFVFVNSGGDEVWAATYGSDEYIENPTSLVQADDGGFVICGLVGYSHGGEGMDDMDYFLRKIDSEGNVQWHQTYGNDEQSEIVMSLIQLEGEGYVIGGVFSNEFGGWGSGSGDFLMTRTNADGDVLWSRTFVGDATDFCMGVVATEDGGYALAGFTDSFGEGEYDFLLVKTGADPVSVPDIINPVLPEQISLFPAYPNPFNSTTTISYGLPSSDCVSVQLYNLSGERISTLFEGDQQAGVHSMTMSASDMPSGLYFAKLTSSSRTAVERLIVIK